MARHVFSVLCRRSITDQESNLLSIVDVLDGIAVAPKEPGDAEPKDVLEAIALDASFVSQFTRSTPDKAEEFETRVLQPPALK